MSGPRRATVLCREAVCVGVRLGFRGSAKLQAADTLPSPASSLLPLLCSRQSYICVVRLGSPVICGGGACLCVLYSTPPSCTDSAAWGCHFSPGGGPPSRRKRIPHFYSRRPLFWLSLCSLPTLRTRLLPNLLQSLAPQAIILYLCGEGRVACDLWSWNVRTCLKPRWMLFYVLLARLVGGWRRRPTTR